MINKITEQIIDNAKELDAPELKIFKVKRRMRMLENGGLDILSLIRLLLSFIAVILDFIVLIANARWLSSNIFIIAIIAVSNIILFSSGDVLMEVKYLLRAIRIRETEYEFENANVFLLQGNVAEKKDNRIKLSTTDGSYEIATELYRVEEKFSKYRIGSNIICCCIEDGGTFEIMDCLEYNSYTLKAKQLYRTYKMKNSKAYRTFVGVMILMVIAYILSLIISNFIL